MSVFFFFGQLFFSGIYASLMSHESQFRATSHTRLRARDHYTSSTLIGGKGGAGPSSLHTTLEGPTEYVNARWNHNLHGFLHLMSTIQVARLTQGGKRPLENSRH